MGPFQFTSSDYMYELLGIKLVIIKGLTKNGINPNTDGMLIADISRLGSISIRVDLYGVRTYDRT